MKQKDLSIEQHGGYFEYLLKLNKTLEFVFPNVILSY